MWRGVVVVVVILVVVLVVVGLVVHMLWLVVGARHGSQLAAGAQSLFVLSVSLTPTQLLAMAHLPALCCLQLWAGTFGLGLALEVDGGVLKQKDEAGPVGPVSFRL